MNEYFDQVVPRRGTNSMKWDCMKHDDVLPMWVADMDFQTAPCVTEALVKRAQHGIFGYTKVPASYYQAIDSWFRRRHGLAVDAEWVIYTSGVVPALSAIIKGLTEPGDKVLIQTPVYNCFFSSIRNNGCVMEESPLVYAEGRYCMDFEDLERRAADPAVKLFLLCNPHNPVGRVWSREELVRVDEVCRAHGVVVLADEIHCELTYPGHDYTPFASLSEEALKNSVTCLSPSKAFNLAGIQIANIVAADPTMRQRIDKAINVNEVCDVNCFSAVALEAAYNHGEEWLDALRVYLYENYRTVCAYFRDYLPNLYCLPLEGTYLVWIDCAGTGRPASELLRLIEKRGRVVLNGGKMYGDREDRFLRMNIACPRQLLMQGLNGISLALTDE